MKRASIDFRGTALTVCYDWNIEGTAGYLVVHRVTARGKNPDITKMILSPEPGIVIRDFLAQHEVPENKIIIRNGGGEWEYGKN